MVAVDIDGVVASVYEIVVAEAAKRIGVEPPGVGDDYRISKWFPEGTRRRASRALKEAFRDPDLFARATPLPGAVDALNEMNGFGVFSGYVTARHKDLADVTLNWLADNGFPGAPVIFVEKGALKWQAMQDMGATVIIEDSLRVAESVMENNLAAILFGYKYNGYGRGYKGITINGDHWNELRNPQRTHILGLWRRPSGIEWP